MSNGDMREREGGKLHDFVLRCTLELKEKNVDGDSGVSHVDGELREKWLMGTRTNGDACLYNVSKLFVFFSFCFGEKL